MKNKYVFTAALLLCLSALGAGIILMGSSGSARKGQEKKVVTSFYPVYIAAKNVIGDVPGVALENLTEPQTGCLHDYQMTPEDLIALSGADLFLINGGGIENFAEDAAAQYPALPIVTVSEGIDYLEAGEPAGHDHGPVNAHVWMDIGRYAQEVENIAEVLAKTDPEHAGDYERNAREYQERLEELKGRMLALQEKAAGRRIVIFHDAFAYFADAAGLTVAHVIDMDENTALSANRISELVELIRREKIDILLAEAQYGTKIADAVSRETDARVYVLDSLVTGPEDADSYLRGMEANIRMLEEALEGGREQ